jgi:hypothetical protein
MSWTKRDRDEYLRLAELKMDLAREVKWGFMGNLTWHRLWPGGWSLLGSPSVINRAEGQKSITFEVPEGIGAPDQALLFAIRKVKANQDRLKEEIRWYCKEHDWEEILSRGVMSSGCPECGRYNCEELGVPSEVEE